jgi:hypothetical protein
LLDLKYDEDSRAEVDMNIVCAGDGRFIEVQGTAEGRPFTREQMDDLLELGRKGIEQLVRPATAGHRRGGHVTRIYMIHRIKEVSTIRVSGPPIGHHGTPDPIR